VASKAGQRSRIRRAGHGPQRGMTSLYYAGTVEPAISMPDPRGQLYLNFLSVDTFLQASIGADRTQRRAATRDHEAAAGRIRPVRCYLVIPCIEIHYIACLRGLLPRPSGAPSDGWMCPASGQGVQTRPNCDVENGRVEVILVLKQNVLFLCNV